MYMSIFNGKIKLLCAKYIEQNKLAVCNWLFSFTNGVTYTAFSHTAMIMRQTTQQDIHYIHLCAVML